MTTLLTLLGGLTPAAFLDAHWQKTPLLVRGALPGFTDPLTPEELAGLACESGVESRLVTRKGARWSLAHGPFRPARFEKLPERDWTVLVQAVDQLVPAAAGLLAPFRFLPSWRVDDVMVSYAAPGGGVGPHVDRYDVFLIQGMGVRRWRLGGMCDAATPMAMRGGLHQLAEFEPVEEYDLGPGDMLYLPPGIAHDGVAVDACLTYSVGFRAPSAAEIVDGMAGEMQERLPDDRRYSDADAAPAANPGEIGGDALRRLRDVLNEAMRDDDALMAWFGRFMTEPKYEHLPIPPDREIAADDLRNRASAGAGLHRAPGSRLAFAATGGGVTLFADGAAHECPGRVAQLARQLCAEGGLPAEELRRFMSDAACTELLAELANAGSLYFQED